MKKRSLNRKGFTLIEMLLVLSVISVITSVAILQLRPLIETKKATYFFTQLEEDILLGQQSALSMNRSVRVEFNTQDHYYHIWVNGEAEPLLTRHYDQRIEASFGTLTNPLTFSTNGNTRRAGTMLFHINEDDYKLVFQLGRGRFYVEKL